MTTRLSLRRALVPAGIVLVGTASGLVFADPVLAHGFGSREDLPLPFPLVATGGAVVLVVSFLALGVLWKRSRWEADERGRVLPDWLQSSARVVEVVARVVSLGLFVLVLGAALAGRTNPVLNIAPVTIYVAFWVGLQVVSAIVGNVWSFLSPFDTVAAVAARIRRRIKPERRAAIPGAAAGPWVGVCGLFGYTWLELVYPNPDDVRILGIAMLAYSVAMFAGAALWGRGWLRTGDGFAAYFGLLAKMGVLFRDARGQVRIRPPLRGLARLEMTPAATAIVLVALGSTTYDGLRGTQFWVDTAGSPIAASGVLIGTVGLVVTIGIISASYLIATREVARSVGQTHESVLLRFAHSLIPIAIAYTLAHYFSLLVFEAQQLIPLASDPLGQGYDLFGTSHVGINFTILTATAVAAIQVVSIVLGHIAGVVVAHDRATADYDTRLAVKSQIPLLIVMVVYTIGGMLILMGAE